MLWDTSLKLPKKDAKDQKLAAIKELEEPLRLQVFRKRASSSVEKHSSRLLNSLSDIFVEQEPGFKCCEQCCVKNRLV